MCTPGPPSIAQGVMQRDWVTSGWIERRSLTPTPLTHGHDGWILLPSPPLGQSYGVGMADWAMNGLHRDDLPLLNEWLVHRIRSTGAIALGSYTYTWYSTATHPGGRVNIGFGLAFRPLLRAEGTFIAHVI